MRRLEVGHCVSFDVTVVLKCRVMSMGYVLSVNLLAPRTRERHYGRRMPVGRPDLNRTENSWRVDSYLWPCPVLNSHTRPITCKLSVEIRVATRFCDIKKCYVFQPSLKNI
jgi:hypothetical protein